MGKYKFSKEELQEMKENHVYVANQQYIGEEQLKQLGSLLKNNK